MFPAINKPLKKGSEKRVILGGVFDEKHRDSNLSSRRVSINQEGDPQPEEHLNITYSSQFQKIQKKQARRSVQQRQLLKQYANERFGGHNDSLKEPVKADIEQIDEAYEIDFIEQEFKEPSNLAERHTNYDLGSVVTNKQGVKRVEASSRTKDLSNIREASPNKVQEESPTNHMRANRPPKLIVTAVDKTNSLAGVSMFDVTNEDNNNIGNIETHESPELKGKSPTSDSKSALAMLGKGYLAPQEKIDEIDGIDSGDEDQDQIDVRDVQLAKNAPFQSSLKFQSLPSFQLQNQNTNDGTQSKSILKKPRYKSKVDKKMTNQHIFGANNQVMVEQSMPNSNQLSNSNSITQDILEANRKNFMTIESSNQRDQNFRAPPILSTSRISIFSGEKQDQMQVPSGLESNATTLQSLQSNLSQVKKYSPAIGKNHFSLKIRSSRAFEDQEHSNLYDILEKVDKIASLKKKRDQQKANYQTGMEQASKSAKAVEKKKGQKEKRASISPDGDKFAQEEREMILKQRKEAEERAQTDRKIFEALKIPYQQNQTIKLKHFNKNDFRSKSTIKPQIQKPMTDMNTTRSKKNLSQLKMSATINSPYYIQNQWEEINHIAQKKRSLVHELAEQQKQTHFKVKEQLSNQYATIQNNTEKDIYSKGDYIKSMKPTKKISRVSPQILRGIEENQEYVDRGQSKRTMTDHEAYEKLQKLFQDRPRRPTIPYDLATHGVGGHSAFMARTLQRAKDKQTKNQSAKKDSPKPPEQDTEVHVSKAELLRERLNKMPHDRIMKVKRDLYDLILSHLTNKNVKENNVHKISENSLQDVKQLLKDELARMMRAHKAEHQDLELNQIEIKRQDILMLFGRMDLSLTQEQKETMEERIQMSKKSLSSIRKINSTKYDKDKNYLIQALEDLPEGELARLVEILLEERNNEINIGKKREKRERINESRKTLDQSKMGMNYILTHPSQMSIAQSNLSQNGEPNPLRFKINSFQNTIDLKKKQLGADSNQYEAKKEETKTLSQLGQEGIFKSLIRQGSNTSIQHINNPEFELPNDQPGELNEMSVSFQIPGGDIKKESKRPQKLAIPNMNLQQEKKPYMGVSVSRPSIFTDNESAFQLRKAPLIEEQIEAEARSKLVKEETQHTYSPYRIDEYNEQQFQDESNREYSTILCIPEESKEEEYTLEIQKQMTTNTDALRAVYCQIVERKSRFAPVFSGNLGYNIYDNSEYMLEMFRTLPVSPIARVNGLSQKNQTTPFEIDEFFKLEENQNIKQAVQKQSNLSQEQRIYYEKMCQMFMANQDTKHELAKQRQESRGPLNFKHIFASQVSTGRLAAGSQQQHVPPGALHSIDLKRAARQYQNGLYYLMSVLDHKILDLQGVDHSHQKKGLSINKLKSTQAKGNIVQQLKRRAQMLVDSPFQKIDHFNQAHEDSENLVPAMISKITYTKGSKPSSRAYFGCQFARGKFYVFGGAAQRPMNDLRSLTLSTSEWKREDKQEAQISFNKDGRFDSALSYVEQDKKEAKGGIPSISRLQPRFQFSFCVFMDKYLVVFGGAGNYVNQNIQRQTYNDLFFWDLTSKDKSENQTGEWIDMSLPAKENKMKQAIMKEAQFDKDWKIGYTMHSGRHIKEKKADIVEYDIPEKRCQHVMGVYGGCLVVNGGYQTEHNRVLDDFALYDIALGMWVRFKQPKKDKKICVIGPRYQHSLTSVQDPNVDIKKRNTRVMWIQHANSIISQVHEDPMVKNKKRRAFEKSGMFIFGGLNGSHQPKNDLYLVTPHYERNIKYLTSEKANYKKSINATICFSVKKLNPTGRPPAPRYAHAATFISKYLVIHGGRNDDFYESMRNIALNDLHLYDVNSNIWCTVAIFGEIPQSRWGHVICGENSPFQDYKKTNMIIFGGVNLNSFFDTTIYKISIDTNEFIKAHQENEQAIGELHAQGQYLLGAEKSKEDSVDGMDEDQ